MNFIYNGVEYDIGTKFKIETSDKEEQIMTLEKGGVTGLELVGNNTSIPIRSMTFKFITDIVEPVYPQITNTDELISSRSRPTKWDVETGWIWYIIIMIIGTIFKDRLLIWTFTSAIFFLWKNGFLNGGNK